jgi:hypothetical protein
VKRRVFNVLTVVSAVLCVATAALWVASFSRAFEIGYRPSPTRLWYLNCSAGQMFIVRRTGPLTPGPGSPQQGRFTWLTYPHPPLGPTNRHTAFSFLGFEMHSRMVSASANLVAVIWPCWAVVLSTLLLPARWLQLRWIARRKRIAGMCMNCGYDLRATPERCPECGSVQQRARID